MPGLRVDGERWLPDKVPVITPQPEPVFPDNDPLQLKKFKKSGWIVLVHRTRCGEGQFPASCRPVPAGRPDFSGSVFSRIADRR